MIKRISKLKNCGIFRDFKWSSSLVEFDKYNLIYGLNGSGKSTLSQALSFFAVNYDNASCPLNFEIELMEDNGISVGNRIKNQKLKHLLYVFNKDFVQKNLDTNGKLDEIIYLSKENIEIKNEMAELDKELSKIRAQKILTNKLYQEKKKTVDRLLPEIASKVKSILVSLGGISANTYANFDKRGAENYFSFSNKQLDVDIPNYDNEIEALKISLKELVLPYLDFKVSLIDTELINEFISKVKALLVKSISKQLITDYSKEILQWVETGLNLHKDTNVCIYCGGIISDERTAFLKGLFNEEYKKFKAELRNAIVTLESLKMQPIYFYGHIYYENKIQLEHKITAINSNIIKINTLIDGILEQLNQKMDNIEVCSFKEICVDDELLKNYNDIANEINNIINIANEKTKNFKESQKNNLEKLKNLLLYKFFRESNFKTLFEDFNKTTEEDKKLEVKIREQEQKISLLENTIKDVLIAADNFNNLLHQFLGRKEIILKFDESVKGYKLIRLENKSKAERLSEGEKTAIAFIYFLTKIQENGNRIEDTIIVLDDPISSLDSNNLFNSFAFIVSAFEKCHQFFVLTHNFTFFSLLKRKIGKDWRQGNNMYLIDNTNIMINGESVREAKIVVLPKTLKILNSDYAYNFKLIKDTVEIKNVVTDLNEYFILSNSCRKVLETFSSFKLIGKKDFDIETIKELYLISKQDEETLTIEENAKAEKIFKFVNYYSHGSKFSTIAEIDGLIGETIKIAQSVLELLLLADPVHYNSLIEATN